MDCILFLDLDVSFVDFVEKLYENLFRKPAVNVVDLHDDIFVESLFIVSELFLNVKFVVDILDNTDVLLTVATVILSKNLLIFISCRLQSFHNQPAALAILDISSYLTNHSRVTIAVQVVISDLEVMTNLQQYFSGTVIELLISEACHVHRQHHGEIEAVEAGLVLDYGGVSVHGEGVQAALLTSHLSEVVGRYGVKTLTIGGELGRLLTV